MNNLVGEAALVDRGRIVTIEQTLTGIVQSLVSRPEKVRVEARERGDGLALHLQVAAADWGMVLGQGGRTAHSLEVVASALGERLPRKICLEIETEPNA